MSTKTPCPPGAVGGRAALARGQSSPWLPVAGDARATLARGRSPPAEKIFFVKRQPKLYLVDV